MRQFPKKIFDRDVVDSTVYNADKISAEYIFQMSAQITASGGGSGVLNIQASDDSGQGSGFSPSAWSTVATIPVTGDGVFIIPKTDICYEWIRVQYSCTVGGHIVVNAKIMGIN